MSLPAGHRLLPHTADCIIEAWGPDRAACLTEALMGLVEGFAEVADACATQVVPLRAGPGSAKDELVAVFEQVIFSVDVFSVVPVRFHLGETMGNEMQYGCARCHRRLALTFEPMPTR